LIAFFSEKMFEAEHLSEAFAELLGTVNFSEAVLFHNICKIKNYL